LTTKVSVSQTNLAHEKAVRLYPPKNAPQSVPSLWTRIQARVRHSKDVSSVPSGNASMRVRVPTNDSVDAQIRPWSQPTIRKSLEKTNQGLRMRLRNCDPGFRSAPLSAEAFREWAQHAQTRNRSLAGSARTVLCVWVRRADQTQSASVEIWRVSLHLGPQSRRQRRSTSWMEGGMFASEAADRKPQGLYSLASSSFQAGPLHLPEVRCEKELGSRPHGRLFRDRCPDRGGPSSNPRFSYPGDRNNPLSQVSSWQACSVASLPTRNPSHQGSKTEQECQIPVSRSGDSQSQNANLRLPWKSTV
jgi:hypothetical protein